MPAIGLAAAERAAQVLPASISRVGDEKNPAVPAPAQARPHVRLPPEHGAHHEVVLQDQGAYLATAIPVAAKLKSRLDSYSEKPRVSLTMLMLLFCMSSSYRMARAMSRVRRGLFVSAIEVVRSPTRASQLVAPPRQLSDLPLDDTTLRRFPADTDPHRSRPAASLPTAVGYSW